MKANQIFYRYELHYDSVILKRFILVRETEHFYFIKQLFGNTMEINSFATEKRIKKNAKKSYAYPDKEKALLDFKKRLIHRHKYNIVDAFNTEFTLRKIGEELDKFIDPNKFINQSGKILDLSPQIVQNFYLKTRITGQEEICGNCKFYKDGYCSFLNENRWETQSCPAFQSNIKKIKISLDNVKFDWGSVLYQLLFDKFKKNFPPDTDEDEIVDKFYSEVIMKYTDYDEFASLELEIDEDLNIKGKIKPKIQSK